MCRTERGTADRGTGDTGVARGVPRRERGIARGPMGAPPLQGEVPREFIAREAEIVAFARQRDQALDDLTGYLRRQVPGVMRGDPNLARSQREMGALEQRFRALMQRADPPPVTGAPRRLPTEAMLQEAEEIMDAATDATRWNDARVGYWRALYSDPAARAYIDRLRQQRVIRVSDYAMQQGYAPEIADIDAAGRRRFYTLDIDHTIPRERVPFYAYQPENLRVQVAPYNRQYLNQTSYRTGFPMGRDYGRVSDEIEEFVQSHMLSRRQRREARTRGLRRGASALGALLVTVLGAQQAHALATRAEEYRAARRRRTAAMRHRERIAPGGIDAANIDGTVERVFPVDPLEMDRELVNDFEIAVRAWFARDFGPRGAGRQQFEDRLAELSRQPDVDALNALLEQVGHPHMRSGTGFVLGDMARIGSAASHLEDARRIVARLLEPQAQYLERAAAFDRLSTAHPEAIQALVPEFAIDIDDLMEIHDHAAEEGHRFRHYVSALRQALESIDRARELNADRFRRVEDALVTAEAAGERARGPVRGAQPRAEGRTE